MSFWDFMWFIFVSYVFIAYLMVMFSVIGDIFRDRSTGGFSKALWIVAMIFLPVLTLLVYLIAKGRGMAERSVERAQQMQHNQEAYIREVAASAPAARAATPVDQVTQAKALLDSGTISPAEFESMKAKALASV
jgi:heme/copper-type cytochrome/quinol oxidase subunit 2